MLVASVILSVTGAQTVTCSVQLDSEGRRPIDIHRCTTGLLKLR